MARREPPERPARPERPGPQAQAVPKEPPARTEQPGRAEQPERAELRERPERPAPPAKKGPRARPERAAQPARPEPQGPAGNAAIATFASAWGVPSGYCLNYTELAGQGNGPCPAKTSGYSPSNLLAGPTPANGATVTNLYADTNTTLSGTETATVAVIDNTTGATLLSCTVTARQEQLLEHQRIRFCGAR